MTHTEKEAEDDHLMQLEEPILKREMIKNKPKTSYSFAHVSSP